MKIIVFSCFLVFSHARIVQRVVGGQNVNSDEFSSIVSLQAYNNVTGSYLCFCGGAILDEYWILTAAHCVRKLETLDVTDQAFPLIIVSGTFNIEYWNPFWQVSIIEKFFRHEQYAGISFNSSYDIGLIKLRYPLRIHKSMRPLPLSSKFEHEGTAVVAGWGDADDDNLMIVPNYLKSLEVDIIDHAACKKAVKTLNESEGEYFSESFVHLSHICTGPLTGGKSACIGDSGGPLLQKNSYGEYEIIGIISLIASPCGRVGAPTLHANIYTLIPWIENIKRNN